MCTVKVQLNINTQLIITALKFTDFPDHVSKDYGYTFFVGFLETPYVVTWCFHKQKYDFASTKLTPQTGYEKLFRTLCKLQIKKLGFGDFFGLTH